VKKISQPADSILGHLKRLKHYIDKTTIGDLKADWYTLCVKASLAKCYEFNVAIRTRDQPSLAFFWAPALRGICEELIVLKFADKLPKDDRQNLIQLLMTHDVYSRIKSQDKFFSATRPQQPVLRVRDAETILGQTEAKIRKIWNSHGWPNLKYGTMPQIRQLAERQDQSVLATLYDYLYRFTSGTVHFSVQSLFRSGWGDSPECCKFSTTHFEPYFSAFALVYGAFLFCVYFESFGRTLRPNKKVVKIVSEIRKEIILEPRWPEMLTFEEMNLKPPDDSPILRLLLSAVQARETKSLLKLGESKPKV